MERRIRVLYVQANDIYIYIYICKDATCVVEDVIYCNVGQNNNKEILDVGLEVECILESKNFERSSKS